VLVERLAVQAVHPLGVLLPLHPVVGLLLRGRCARPCPRPLASSASHPVAAAVSRVEPRGDQRGRKPDASGRWPVTTERTDGPSGTSGTPTRSSSAANSSSGGAHTRTSDFNGGEALWSRVVGCEKFVGAV
jgi:hypothetical protein